MSDGISDSFISYRSSNFPDTLTPSDFKASTKMMSFFESSIQYIHRSPPGLDTIGMFSSTLDKAYNDLHTNTTPLPELHSENGFIFFDTDYRENNIKNSINYTICLLKTLYELAEPILL